MREYASFDPNHSILDGKPLATPEEPIQPNRVEPAPSELRSKPVSPTLLARAQDAEAQVAALTARARSNHEEIVEREEEVAALESVLHRVQAERDEARAQVAAHEATITRQASVIRETRARALREAAALMEEMSPGALGSRLAYAIRALAALRSDTDGERQSSTRGTEQRTASATSPSQGGL